MRRRPLPSRERLLEVLSYDPETGILSWRAMAAVRGRGVRHGGEPAFTRTNFSGYLAGMIDGVDYLAHRVIWKIATGDEPASIDHINGDRRDNSLANLRLGEGTTNAKNAAMRRDNRSGVVGVSAQRGRWTARIRDRGELIFLGTFDTIEEAASARRAAERDLGFHPNHGRPPEHRYNNTRNKSLSAASLTSGPDTFNKEQSNDRR